MTYRKDESKDNTIMDLRSRRRYLLREIRMVENAIDWLEEGQK